MANGTIAASTLVRVYSLYKSYGAHRVLTDVSFALRSREVLALGGVSGSGKTTLIRILCGLTGFDRGELHLAGRTVPAGAPYPADLFGKIGVVFQEHHLFPHLTALDNVTLALRSSRRLSAAAARERGLAELERMGLADLAERYPASLSGGEKQRVVIARALAVDPLLLLLDEPTANLDPDRVTEVGERIVELAAAGTTMLLATHNLELARAAAHSFALLENSCLRLSSDAALLEDLRRSRT